jgi:hypothetical protein
VAPGLIPARSRPAAPAASSQRRLSRPADGPFALTVGAGAAGGAARLGAASDLGGGQAPAAARRLADGGTGGERGRVDGGGIHACVRQETWLSRRRATRGSAGRHEPSPAVAAPRSKGSFGRRLRGRDRWRGRSPRIAGAGPRRWSAPSTSLRRQMLKRRGTRVEVDQSARRAFAVTVRPRPRPVET